MKLQHTHHGVRAELTAYSQVPAPVELIIGLMTWLPGSVVALFIGWLISVGVEQSGLWLVNEWVMVQRILVIGFPVWAVLYATLAQIYRRGTWQISVNEEELTMRWTRLGQGSTWTVPMRSIQDATLTFYPLSLVLHFRDGTMTALQAQDHQRSDLRPLADAISHAARRSRDRPEVAAPAPPRALLSMLSKRESQ